MKSKLMLALLLTSSIAGKSFAVEKGGSVSPRSSVSSMASTESLNSVDSASVSPAAEKNIFTARNSQKGAKKINPNKYYLWIDKKKVSVSDHTHFPKLIKAFKDLGLVDEGQDLQIDDARLYDATTVALVNAKAEELMNVRSDKKAEYADARDFIITAHFSNLYYQKGLFVTKFDNKIYQETAIEKRDGRIVNTGKKGMIRQDASASAAEIYQALEECKIGRANLERQMEELRNDFASQLSEKDVKLQIVDLEKQIEDLEKLLESKKAELKKIDPTNLLFKEQVLPQASAPANQAPVDLLNMNDLSLPSSVERAQPSTLPDLLVVSEQATKFENAAKKIQQKIRARKQLKSEQQKEILDGSEGIVLEKAMTLLLPFNRNINALTSNDLHIAEREKENLIKERSDKRERIEAAYALIEGQIKKSSTPVDSTSAARSEGLNVPPPSSSAVNLFVSGEKPKPVMSSTTSAFQSLDRHDSSVNPTLNGQNRDELSPSPTGINDLYTSEATGSKDVPMSKKLVSSSSSNSQHPVTN